MPKKLLTIVPLVLATLAPSALQGGKKKWDFKETVKKAQEALDKKSYGACLAELKTALAEVSKLRAAVILESLPAAPGGFTEQKQEGGAGDFAMLAFMGAGMEVKKEYKKGGDNGGTVRFQVLAESPLVAGLLAMVTNPMLVASDPTAEIVKFGPDKGVVRANKDDKSGKAEIVIASTHYVTIEWNGLTREEAEPFFTEAVIKKLAETLNN